MPDFEENTTAPEFYYNCFAEGRITPENLEIIISETLFLASEELINNEG